MKKYFLAFLCLLTAHAGVTQNMDVELPATQSLFIEAGGAGLPYSFNYDFRFDKLNIDSWGMRIGVGAYALNDDSFFSLPIQITRLMGKNNHYFEIGGGITIVAFKNTTEICDFNSSGQFVCEARQNASTSYVIDITGSPNVVGTLIFGYRRMPENGGFTWRANLNPLFNSSGFWPLWLGVGLGYAF